MHWIRFCSVGLLLLTALNPLWAADSAKEARALLEKMTHATRTLNYDGTFVYMHEGRFITMRILHGADAKGERERLLSLSGAAREVMRDDQAQTCVMSDSRKVAGSTHTRRPFSGALSIDASRLVNYYDFTRSGEDRVANRSAHRVAIKPRDSYRYGYQLSIDGATGLLLKSELINEDGIAVEQIMFTSLGVTDGPPAALQGHCESKRLTPHHEQHRETRSHVPVAAGWQVTQLPAGFTLVEHDKHPIRTSTVAVEHLIFSDGLALVSVFIERLEEDDKFSGFSHRGAVSAFGAVVDDHQITVVGEVPRATVQLIAESIQKTTPEVLP